MQLAGMNLCSLITLEEEDDKVYSMLPSTTHDQQEHNGLNKLLESYKELFKAICSSNQPQTLQIFWSTKRYTRENSGGNACIWNYPAEQQSICFSCGISKKEGRVLAILCRLHGSQSTHYQG